MKTSAPLGVTARASADSGISSIELCAARNPVGTVAGSTCVTWFAIAAPAAARARAATPVAIGHLLIGFHLLLGPPKRPSLENETSGRAVAEQRDIRDPEPGEFLERARAERRLFIRGREEHHHHRHVRSLRLRVSGVDVRSGGPSRSSGSSLDFQFSDPRSELGAVPHTNLLQK